MYIRETDHLRVVHIFQYNFEILVPRGPNISNCKDRGIPFQGP